MKYLLTLLVFLSSVVGVHAQEFVQKDIKVIINYPFNDGPDKFQVKYISSDKKPPQDSIFEEKHHQYRQDSIFDDTNKLIEIRSNFYDRTSLFLWKSVEPRDLVFFTGVDLLNDPLFRYNYFDEIPAEKFTFYITENIFSQKITMVYAQGSSKVYDNVTKDGYKNPDNVMVTIFDPGGSYGSNFSFHESVTKHTAFKVLSGKDANGNYFKIDMYQDAQFVKRIFDWPSTAKLPFLQTNAVSIHKKPVSHIMSQKIFNMTYDLNGRQVNAKVISK